MSYDPFGDDEDIFLDDQDTEEILEGGPDPDLDSKSNNRHNHTIDGSECPTCETVHHNPFGSLDAEAQDAMLSFLDSLPDGLVRELLGDEKGSNKRPQAEMLTAFLGFTERMDKTNTIGPALRAIIEHLDEETGGRITAKWRIYDTERRLVLTHKILKSVNTALDDAITNEASKSYTSLLELLTDFAKERIEFLITHYEEVSKTLNYEPLESVIDNGTYPDDVDRNAYDMFSEELYKELSAH